MDPVVVPIAETNDVAASIDDGGAGLLFPLDVATTIDDDVLHLQVAAAIDSLEVPADSATGPLVTTGSELQDVDTGDNDGDLLSLDLTASGPPLVAIATADNPDLSYDELRARVAISKHDTGAKPTTLRIDLAASSNDGIFPLGLLCDILLRVPATAICRFRCVSTSWRSLLRHPNFIAAHTARNPPRPLIAATVRLDRGTVMGINLLDTSGNVVKKIRSHAAVAGCSVNGTCAYRELACLVGTDRRLRVLDAATGAAAAYPPKPRGALTCTLGRVPSTGEYKVLAMVSRTRRWGHGHYQVGMVLTLGSSGGGWWREIGGPPAIVRRRHSDVAVVRGVAYFSKESCLPRHEQEAHMVVEFNLETEEWLPEIFYGPPASEDDDHAAPGPGDHYDISLAEVNGFLVAAQRHRHGASAVMKLWFMMEKTKTTHTWHPLYTIAMADHGASSRFRFEKPLQVLEDGRIVVWSSTADGSHDGMPQIYDPVTETLTDGAVTPKCYAVGTWTGCLLRLGSSDPRSHKTLQLLGDAAAGSSRRQGGLRAIEYGSKALVVRSTTTSVY
uniref:Uncharacterized protein n=1 Tax=Avena sativa TaxID=4498 RepID=A0ACD5Z6N0_AVESA